jgi:threonine dehydratase
MNVTAQAVVAAAAVIRGSVSATPCLHSRTLSEVTGAAIWIKFENLQFTGSFKERGALNKLASLAPNEAARGVVTASAGNHAQGVAYHARRLGIAAVIVMPQHTPHVKVERTRAFGAEIVLAGNDFDEAYSRARALAAERGLEFVHPYDDEKVIAGQGTTALEMMDAEPALEVLVVPVGGGGLIAGMALAARHVKPRIEIVGVQSQRFPSMYSAFRAVAPQFGSATIADGIAVKTPGALTGPIVRRCVDEILLVDEGDIEQAILLLLEIEKTVAEGAGAVALAAVMREPERFAGRKVGVVLSGGNIEPLLLASIIERGMVRSGRLARLRVELRDLPGALAQVTALISQLGANIEEVHHQRAFTRLPPQVAAVDFVLQTRDAAHVEEILGALQRAGYAAQSAPGE